MSRQSERAIAVLDQFLQLRVEDVPNARRQDGGKVSQVIDNVGWFGEQPVKGHQRRKAGKNESSTYIATPPATKVTLSLPRRLNTRQVMSHQPPTGISDGFLAVRPRSAAVMK